MFLEERILGSLYARWRPSGTCIANKDSSAKSTLLHFVIVHLLLACAHCNLPTLYTMVRRGPLAVVLTPCTLLRTVLSEKPTYHCLRYYILFVICFKANRLFGTDLADLLNGEICHHQSPLIWCSWCSVAASSLSEPAEYPTHCGMVDS